MTPPANLFPHEDLLSGLDHPDTPLGDRLDLLLRGLQRQEPGIRRLAVAVIDPGGGDVSVFLYAGTELDLKGYHQLLAEAPSLVDTLQRGRPRVVNDLAVFDRGTHSHTHAVREGGLACSYTLPIYQHGKPIAFVFINGDRPGLFREPLLDVVDCTAHLAGELVKQMLDRGRLLRSIVNTATEMVGGIDPETSGHLERMAHYARLITRELLRQGRYAIDDERVEQIFLFAPLHDIGKIAIPLEILHKPGKLTEAERQEIRKHAERGAEMLRRILAGTEGVTRDEGRMMVDIAAQHHERMNGSGYPLGLSGEEIAIEARIVAVADVFDALTSPRSYKQAWPLERALRELERLSRDELDLDCFQALMRNRGEVEDILARYPG